MHEHGEDESEDDLEALRKKGQREFEMALWASQREDHTSDWLRTVPISGLGQTMKAWSRVFARDIYGDHAVSRAEIIGIKHRHNVVRDPLVDKKLAPGWIISYSVRAVIDAAQRKRGKYMTKCAAIRYGFLPFSFSSLGELEADAVTLLKRIRKFFMAQDIGSRPAVHIFNRISFAIAKGVGAQIVSRLPSNLLATPWGLAYDIDIKTLKASTIGKSKANVLLCYCYLALWLV
ncbi:hypothetical protein Tco_1530658 [Tanacetum coccineum]